MALRGGVAEELHFVGREHVQVEDQVLQARLDGSARGSVGAAAAAVYLPVGCSIISLDLRLFRLATERATA
jgi:hypothetical protein